MTILQIQLENDVAQSVEKKARQAGKTPEAWAAEVVAEQATPGDSKEWIKKFLEHARQHPGNSRGWKWNREELYDRHAK